MNALLYIYVIGYAVSLFWAARLSANGVTTSNVVLRGVLIAIAAMLWPAFFIALVGIWTIGVMTTQPTKEE